MGDDSPIRPSATVDGDPDSPASRPGVAGALRDLSDSLTQLIQQQIALLRLEVSREASEAGSRSAKLLVFAGLGLVGYILLNIAIICLAGYFAGIAGMTLTAFGLATLHIVVAAIQIHRQMEGFEEQQARLETKAKTLAGKDASETPQIETEVESQEST